MIITSLYLHDLCLVSFLLLIFICIEDSLEKLKTLLCERKQDKFFLNLNISFFAF